jgi:molybdate transport repressor ModE-like protein
MEPRYLRQLAEIIDLGSLSLAAKSLNVSQPTLSRNIKSLEALIGAPVLRRGRYGVTPTHIGAALGREGRAIREALRQAELDLGRWKGGLDG